MYLLYILIFCLFSCSQQPVTISAKSAKSKNIESIFLSGHAQGLSGIAKFSLLIKNTSEQADKEIFFDLDSKDLADDKSFTLKKPLSSNSFTYGIAMKSVFEGQILKLFSSPEGLDCNFSNDLLEISVKKKLEIKGIKLICKTKK